MFQGKFWSGTDLYTNTNANANTNKHKTQKHFQDVHLYNFCSIPLLRIVRIQIQMQLDGVLQKTCQIYILLVVVEKDTRC